MRTAHAMAVIGCVLILAAGLGAGCTGAAGMPPVPKAAAAHPAKESLASVPFVPAHPATSPPGNGVSPAPGTTFRTVYVNGTSSGGIVTIPVGDRVLVRLSEIPGTGFAWNATASKGLRIVSDTYGVPDSNCVNAANCIGAPGYHEWILSPETVDTYTFRAVSDRPWEEANGAGESFILVIVAMPS